MVVFFKSLFLVKLSDRVLGLKLTSLFLREHFWLDQSPFGTDIWQRIICDLQLKFEKALLFPLPIQYNVETQKKLQD